MGATPCVPAEQRGPFIVMAQTEQTYQATESEYEPTIGSFHWVQPPNVLSQSLCSVHKVNTKAEGPTFCQGQYQTAPVVGARTGYKVDVKCKILFGAAPGPGCVTAVRDILVLILSQQSLNTGIQPAAWARLIWKPGSRNI